MTKAGATASAVPVGGKDLRAVEEEQMGSGVNLEVVEKERVKYSIRRTCLGNREEWNRR